MFPMRTVVLGTFVPTILFEAGVGAILPVVVASATSLGASLDIAGFVLALLAVGQILADLPAGMLAARIGDRSAMMLAGIVAALACVVAAFAPNVVALALAILALGGSTAVYFLARQSFLTEVTHPLKRARVLSTLGGVHRIGLLIGPFVGAAVVSLLSLPWVYAASAVMMLGSVGFAALGTEEGGPRVTLRRESATPPVSIASVFRDHRRLFLTLGIVTMLIGAVRSARTTVLPMWGEHLGIDPAQTSLVFAVAALFDALLFYPAGALMDRFGRLWVGVPGMLVMGTGLFLLPFTMSVGQLAAVAVILGLGNGVTSGILMTLGADVAPAEVRSQFLAVWRVFSDLGQAVGPLVLSAAAALGSLAAGVWVMAGSSLASAGAQLRYVPRFTPHASNRTRRAAGLID